MQFVLACGDEGVQINEGTRLGVVGAGFQVPGFSEVVSLLKKQFEGELAVVSSEENDWTKAHLQLSNWEQTNASMQQHIEALADQEGLVYAGYLPFSDPKALKHGVKGHMVRPHGIHIANKILLTVGGGEQTFHLGHYVISADWVADAPSELVTSFLQTQIEFYRSLAGQELPLVLENDGILTDTQKEQNTAVLHSLGVL